MHNKHTRLSTALCASISLAACAQTDIDAIDYQGAEQLLIVIGAMLTIVLGYRLFRHGHSSGPVEATWKGPAMTLTMSGVGPGIAFMFFGCFVLLAGIRYGAASSSPDQEILGNMVDVYAELRASRSAPMPENDLKKQFEATLSSSGFADNAPELASGVRSALREVPIRELATLLLQAGSRETLQALVRNTDGSWVDYLNRGDESSIGFDMIALQTLGLATFAGDIRAAQPTANGVRVIDYLDSADFAGAQRLLEERKRAPDELPVLRPDAGPTSGAFIDFADNWYRLEIDERNSYAIETSTLGLGSDADTVLRLYDAADQREIGFDDDSGSGTFSLLEELLNAGSYLLRVSSFARTPGQYALSVDRSQSTAEIALIPEADQMRPIEPDGLAITDAFDAGEPNWYRFSIENSGFYAIATSASGSEADADTDTELTLYAADGSELGYDDDSADAYPYSSLYEYLDAGTYFLKVSSYWGDPGEYNLAVQPD